MDLPEDTRKFIERKLQKLARHLTTISEINTEISEEKTRAPQDRYVAQITIDVNGPVLRAEGRGANLITAIDQVMEVMERRVNDFKTKSDQKRRGSSPTRGEAAATLNTPESSRRVAVVHQIIKPMSLDEALDQLEKLEEDYLLFVSDRGGIRLLRREAEDQYTLIEPEAG